MKKGKKPRKKEKKSRSQGRKGQKEGKMPKKNRSQGRKE